MVAPVTPGSAKRRLSKVSVDGSSPILALLDWPEDWSCPVSWLHGGRIVALTVDGASLVNIPADGSPPPEPIAIRNEDDEGQFFFSGVGRTVLPDGVHMLSGVVAYDEDGFDNHVGIFDLETGESRVLIENGSFAQYRPPGYLLFTRGDTLLAVRFDLDTLAPAGAQVAIADGLRTSSVWDDALFDITPEGSLLHFPGGIVGGSRQLVYLDGDLDVTEPWGASGWVNDLDLASGFLTSPDSGPWTE